MVSQIKKNVGARVELINHGGVFYILKLNESSLRVILILTDHFLTDESYHVVYPNALIAGVSGDNNLE